MPAFLFVSSVFVSSVRDRSPRAARVLPLAALLAACGCGRPAAAPAVAAAPHALRVSASAAASPAVDTLAQVRAQPLYRQAAQACRAGQYAQAARLLQSLADQPVLSAWERAFVRQQRLVCLQDAHLPVAASEYAAAHAPVPAVSASSTSSVPALRGALSPASPAEADCGPRALLLLCEHEGIKADVPQLRQLAHTTQDGTSLSGLEAAAHAVGLKAEGVQVSREALGDVDMPALAYVNGNHFIAVLSVQGRGDDATATVHDPNERQEQTIGQVRLLRLCSGYLLLAHK